MVAERYYNAQSKLKKDSDNNKRIEEVYGRRGEESKVATSSRTQSSSAHLTMGAQPPFRPTIPPYEGDSTRTPQEESHVLHETQG